MQPSETPWPAANKKDKAYFLVRRTASKCLNVTPWGFLCLLPFTGPTWTLCTSLLQLPPHHLFPPQADTPRERRRVNGHPSLHPRNALGSGVQSWELRIMLYSSLGALKAFCNLPLIMPVPRGLIPTCNGNTVVWCKCGHIAKLKLRLPGYNAHAVFCVCAPMPSHGFSCIVYPPPESLERISLRWTQTCTAYDLVLYRATTQYCLIYFPETRTVQ